tara:strand:+ start:5153 stop:5668 length:516 start_codon:yes stop_codon:yes gene_type:complete
MKIRLVFLLNIIFLIFVLFIFYKSLDKSNLYEPKSLSQNIPQFSAKSFFSNKEINSKNIFIKDKFYLLNIWASWCVPCREEHSILVDLSKNNQLEIIGLNYKDKLGNAQKFLNELGNPYERILIDKDGTKSIEWGAFGVPETFLIHKKKIIKKFVGPLNFNSFEEINKIIK